VASKRETGNQRIFLSSFPYTPGGPEPALP
jgi:hypothetical protein